MIGAHHDIPVDELTISHSDMRVYLDLIRNIDVTVTDEAMLLLRRYFIAARLDRPGKLLFLFTLIPSDLSLW